MSESLSVFVVVLYLVYGMSIGANCLFQSMFRKGNCYDDSIMENFFGVMQQEMYYGVVYYSYDVLCNTIE